MEPELFVSIGFGILAGFISLFVMKGAGNGFLWKIITFAVTTVVASGVAWFIFNKE